MLSVIICTYNREKYIRPLLESLYNNTVDKRAYEILLVDNNCTDHTHEICMQYAADHPDLPLRYIYEHEQGLSAARNTGIANAVGDVLIYVDDDALVDETYLQAYADFFQRCPDVEAAGGPVIPKYETSEPSWMTRYTRELLCGSLDLGNKERDFPASRYPIGCNSAFRASVFQTIGGFNTALGRKGNSLMGAEEKDVFDRMRQRGMTIRYLPSAVLHHCIAPHRLERDYFDRLTYQIGQSERQRTLAMSRGKFLRRLCAECVKWCGTIVLFVLYSVQLHPMKGWKLILFRRNVTRGLLHRS